MKKGLNVKEQIYIRCLNCGWRLCDTSSIMDFSISLTTNKLPNDEYLILKCNRCGKTHFISKK